MTQNVTRTMALISESIGERDCGLYEFNVKSRNGFGISTTGVVGSLNVPTGVCVCVCVCVCLLVQFILWLSTCACT